MLVDDQLKGRREKEHWGGVPAWFLGVVVRYCLMVFVEFEFDFASASGKARRDVEEKYTMPRDNVGTRFLDASCLVSELVLRLRLWRERSCVSRGCRERKEQVEDVKQSEGVIFL
jgi:hypothetical protein